MSVVAEGGWVCGCVGDLSGGPRGAAWGMGLDMRVVAGYD